MVLGYEVQEDGTLNEIELTKDDLNSNLVVCIVDDETKSIYLWKGSQAGVRVKFIGARVATNLRTEYGFNFKVRPLDEGEEPPTFFSALNGTTVASRIMKPGDKAPPPTPPKSKVETSAAETVSTPPPRPAIETPRTDSVPKATIDSPPAKPQTTTSVRIPSTPPSTTRTPATQGEIAEMIKELENLDPPEGYHRELVIVYNDLYTVAEHKTAVFGKEKIERRIEKVRDPPEGTFMAEGFIPRVIVKDGRVLGIELLKGTPDAILSPIKAEMKERLSDLITFFKSETDESAVSAESKAKKGKKLVAK
jgi:hypothetical protein